MWGKESLQMQVLADAKTRSSLKQTDGAMENPRRGSVSRPVVNCKIRPKVIIPLHRLPPKQNSAKSIKPNMNMKNYTKHLQVLLSNI